MRKRFDKTVDRAMRSHMVAYQNRSFARQAGEALAYGRRKHERTAAQAGTVAESTNFRGLSMLSRAATAMRRPIFVLSATEGRSL